MGVSVVGLCIVAEDRRPTRPLIVASLINNARQDSHAMLFPVLLYMVKRLRFRIAAP